tara:strand:+ start:3516 stop:3677 length:162 start_codon:yes stop_codon:yes gene_type:complete
MSSSSNSAFPCALGFEVKFGALGPIGAMGGISQMWTWVSTIKVMGSPEKVEAY